MHLWFYFFILGRPFGGPDRSHPRAAFGSQASSLTRAVGNNVIVSALLLPHFMAQWRWINGGLISTPPWYLSLFRNQIFFNQIQNSHLKGPEWSICSRTVGTRSCSERFVSTHTFHSPMRNMAQSSGFLQAEVTLQYPLFGHRSITNRVPHFSKQFPTCTISVLT